MISNNIIQNYNDNFQMYNNQLRPFLNVAQGMESQFLNFLINEMKKTKVSEENVISQETQYYDSILNDEYSKLMAKKNEGVGIQELILKQILPKHLNNFYNYKKNQNVFNSKNIALINKYQDQLNNPNFISKLKLGGEHHE